MRASFIRKALPILALLNTSFFSELYIDFSMKHVFLETEKVKSRTFVK